MNQVHHLFFQRSYDQFDGFVILHGTDTMAYTASALSFMLEDLGKPVVLSGSQVNTMVKLYQHTYHITDFLPILQWLIPHDLFTCTSALPSEDVLTLILLKYLTQ